MNFFLKKLYFVNFKWGGGGHRMRLPRQIRHCFIDHLIFCAKYSFTKIKKESPIFLFCNAPSIAKNTYLRGLRHEKYPDVNV